MQVCAAHVLSPHDYGVFAKWLTDVALLGLFLIMGLDNAILYFSHNDKGFFEGLSRNLIFFGIGFLSFLCVILFLGMDYFYYISLACTIFLVSSFQSVNAFNQRSENFRAYGAFQFLKSFLILAPFLVVYFMFESAMDANFAFFAYFGGTAISFLMLSAFYMKSGGRLVFAGFLSRSYFQYGFKGMTNTLLAVLLYSASVYCLNIFSTKEAVGAFFLASSVAKLAWVFPDVLGNVLYPRYLKVGRGYSNEMVLSETYFYASLIFLVNVAALLAFIFLGSYVLSAIFPSGYSAIFWPVLWLLVGNQGMVYYKILGRYLASQNQWLILKVSLFCAVLLNVTLNFFFIPRYGVLGAAISTALSFWLCGLIVAGAVKGAPLGFIIGWTGLRGARTNGE